MPNSRLRSADGVGASESDMACGLERNGQRHPRDEPGQSPQEIFLVTAVYQGTGGGSREDGTDPAAPPLPARSVRCDNAIGARGGPAPWMAVARPAASEEYRLWHPSALFVVSC